MSKLDELIIRVCKSDDHLKDLEKIELVNSFKHHEAKFKLTIERGASFAQAKIPNDLAMELLANAIQIENDSSANDRELLKALNLLLDVSDTVSVQVIKMTQRVNPEDVETETTPMATPEAAAEAHLDALARFFNELVREGQATIKATRESDKYIRLEIGQGADFLTSFATVEDAVNDYREMITKFADEYDEQIVVCDNDIVDGVCYMKVLSMATEKCFHA